MPRCKLLEQGTTIQIDGCFSPCCQFEWQQPAPSNYQDFIKLRGQKNQQMQSDQWIPECRWCKDDHEFKGESMRDHVNQTVEGNFWELWFNNTCNLACRMCNAWLSSTWQQNIKLNATKKWHKEFTSWSIDSTPVKFDELVFFDDLPNVKHLKLLGGEPFLIKEVKRTLEYILSKNFSQNINLHLTTNLMQPINDWWINVFESFKSVTLIGSVDGLNSRYEYIRPGASFDQALKTVDQIKTISKVIPNFHFMISSTGQTLNAVQYKATKQFWKQKDIEVDIEQLYYPNFMSYKSLHPDLRKEFGIETTMEYDQSCFDTLVEQMKIQDSVHGTNFELECAELFK